MGQAHRAPPASYQRRFVISRHAVDRFRERVDEEFTARSDEDLGNLLDERIRHADGHQTVEDTHCIGSVTRVFSIQNRDGRDFYAVVRDDTCVTVLDEDMLRVNFENGSWKTGPMNMAFRNALRGVTIPTASPTVERRPVALAQPARALENSMAIDITSVIKPKQSPVELAGIEYARAAVAKYEATAAVVNAKVALLEAEKELDDANKALEAAQAKIIDFAEKGTK
jgi:hypothetical protein